MALTRLRKKANFNSWVQKSEIGGILPLLNYSKWKI